MISFEVEGLPAPQGSHTAISRGGKAALIPAGTTLSRKAFALWRQQVCDAAKDVALDEPLDGPLKVHVTFRFPMPASRSAKLRATGWAWKASKPDLDKLLRAVCDSLTVAQLITDDARIVKVHAEKVEIEGSWHGAEITVAACHEDWQ